MITREEALDLLAENGVEAHLLQHSLASEAVMQGLAEHFGEDSELWSRTGLLHDLDYPKTESCPERHGLDAAEILAGRLPEEALQAIGISSTKLSDSYTDVFSRENKCNGEVIFALLNDQTENITGGYYWFFYHPASDIASQYHNNPVPINETQWLSYSEEFLEVLRNSKTDNNDSRVDCNLGDGDYGASGQNMTWPNKFLGDMSQQPVIMDCDLIYYRYALAVMMDAELKYYQGRYSEALASLNIIAQRAYGKENFYTDNSPQAVLDAITNEYFLEFPAEGVIWWALIRLDRIWDYNSALKDKQSTNPNILLWPISSSAMNKNYKLTQTEGWN